MGTNKIIGEKIQSIRTSKQLTVEDVAERSGLQVAQIERIENNEDFPTLAPLIKIARVLGVRLGTFLDDQTELGPVVSRKKEMVKNEAIAFTSDDANNKKHMDYFSLSQDKSGRHMEPFFIHALPVEPGESFEASSHEGEEFIYVLSGVLEINYGKQTYVLEEGDSIYYDSIVKHHVHAANAEGAKIIGVVYTPY